MTIRAILLKIVRQDDVNFLLTNCMPRRSATRLMGWFSRIEHPLVYAISLWVWRFFSEVDLGDAAETGFRSLHGCFTRRLKQGARPIDADPDILVSPCDGIVGASGVVEGDQVLQVKGSPYSLVDLLGDAAHACTFSQGIYVTIRLTSGMYHHFHAAHDCRIESVTHIFGDTWNVNPITLRRVERLFCRNERALIRTTLPASGYGVTLVAVAAILVAGIRLRFVDISLGPGKKGRRSFPCGKPAFKGEELGWFEHGSTMIVLVPDGFTLHEGIAEGVTVRVGQPLMRMPRQ